ncbi:MAG: DUF4296 domain-containing protein [Bacteroidales bacterium]|nr:DUF4296 domain-containing protein [Bacteroidales bacterium]
MKTRQIVILFAVMLLVASACQRMKAKKPEQLYTQTEIEAVLHDIYLLEGEYRIRQLDTTIVNKTAWLHIRMNQIMEKHNIQYAVFQQNLNYYMSNDDIAKTMLKKVTEQLVKEKTKLENKKNKEKKDTTKVVEQNETGAVQLSSQQDKLVEDN